MSARLLTILVLGLATGSAAAQGYQVRTWGYFDRYPYPPTVGETWSYSYGRPMVTLQDPWGGLVDVPLRPKVLYYDTPFLTPQGWHRPTSIAVMPDPRPRTYVVPSRVIESVPVAPAPAPSVSASPPTFRYDGGPASPVPDVDADPPAPKPIPPRPAPMPPATRSEPPPAPIPPAARPEPQPVPAIPPRTVEAPKSNLPPVPELPKLPDVPLVPGAPPPPAAAANKVPKLGPTPMDIPPGQRPPG